MLESDILISFNNGQSSGVSLGHLVDLRFSVPSQVILSPLSVRISSVVFRLMFHAVKFVLDVFLKPVSKSDKLFMANVTTLEYFHFEQMRIAFALGIVHANVDGF